MAISKITTENKAIPADFGKDESTLICVITGKKSYDKYMKRYVSSEYHGKYEFVLRDEIYSDKYKDTSKYRYVFDLNKLNRTTSTYNPSLGRMESNTITTAAYFITDRKENITYNSPMTSSFFAKLIEAYMINLEAVRLENQPRIQ
ncbi:hypothetical protein MY04_2011 [Flammeovirga sp. MY04]|uniref:hypothetical protein n=1 Tax=Flammeovirga sp. MY04 TaxID=1191459 RepID=UPI0013052AE0|nr:hypothetical protein [Flammeovirga sp. MY04]ANQ49385.2 hypothetical protein MY04_2011 [Flammeovirga sp. MY04]